MSRSDKLVANLVDEMGEVINEEYKEAKLSFGSNNDDNDGRGRSIDLLCNATSNTFQDGLVNQPSLLSALGSAICYFRDAYRIPTNLAACERVGLSDYTVAHHITDCYHHRNFRGA